MGSKGGFVVGVRFANLSCFCGLWLWDIGGFVDRRVDLMVLVLVV